MTQENIVSLDPARKDIAGEIFIQQVSAGACPIDVADLCRDLLPALEHEQCEWSLQELVGAWADGDVDIALVYLDGEHVGTVCGRVELDALVILAAGGRGGPKWFGPLFAFGRDVARRKGVERIMFKGRPAWTRLLAAYGFQPVYTAYRCDLTHPTGEVALEA